MRSSGFSTPLAAQGHIAVVSKPSSHDLDAFRSKIQHVVFLIKENRTFDHYFGTFPGADGTTTGLISSGQRVTL